MKNIIVPTDFSKNAKGAFLYAKELALYLDATIKVVHAAHPSLDPNNPYANEVAENYQTKNKTLLNEFIDRSTQENMADVLTSKMIEREVLIGFAADEIVKLSESDEVDLIVMGTTGTSGILENIFGSVSSHVSQKAKCPVLLVPEGVEFKDFSDILYASNYLSADKKSLKQLIEFASLFPANIHLVHVNEAKNKGDASFEELILKNLFRKYAPKLDAQFITVTDETKWGGINKFAKENSIDLITIVCSHRNFWNRLINKSLTKKMVMSAKLPLLILPLEK